MTLLTKPLALTMGDPAGIGSEIILKAFDRHISSKISLQDSSQAASVVNSPFGLTSQTGDMVVIGDADHLAMVGESLKFNNPLQLIIINPSQLDDIANLSNGNVNAVPVLHVKPDNCNIDRVIPGQLSPQAGLLAYTYLKTAIDLALTGTVAGIVTAPINKQALALAGINYIGHTEILADSCGVSDFAMVMANSEIRVVLVTVHVSVRQACDMITIERELQIIKLAQKACRELGVMSPRIAVAGLNPHGGEDGLIGHEDKEIIAPAIAAARAMAIDVVGPLPGDTVFSRARQGEFDIVVAQTHDQGIIPVKYNGIASGVNITIGLPFVRTSPDHGTAFAISGKGIADPGGMITAIDYARTLIANRQ